eukprot:5556817-Pleurochrysis_carterae.AAC.2
MLSCLGRKPFSVQFICEDCDSAQGLFHALVRVIHRCVREVTGWVPGDGAIDYSTLSRGEIDEIKEIFLTFGMLIHIRRFEPEELLKKPQRLTDFRLVVKLTSGYEAISFSYAPMPEDNCHAAAMHSA